MSIASPWNFTGIWHTGTCCPDIRHFTKYTSGIYSILWKFQHITGLISYGWYSEVYSSHCISLLYDCTLMSTPFTAFIICTPCTHCVDILKWVLRIRNVYIWYTYTTCIHPVSFSRLHIRPLHIYAFSNITFSYCPSRLRMLASG